ncbi:MAG: formate dehydrogenase accessory protein FdhE [Vicinamibacterales bacterium]|nr:formate dehydrogenase accessory protein FdhE [Vicinamibacterales bacterium]
MSRPSPPARASGHEVSELRALAERVPELAEAVSLQVELVTAERRIRSRLATPWIDAPDADLKARLAAGRPLVRFEDLAFDWPECRLLFRQVTDILRRHDAVDAADVDRLHEIGRDPRLPDVARQWFLRAPGIPAAEHPAADAAAPEMLDDVLGWALKPVLTRAADVLQQRLSLADWGAATCPVCGGAPEFGYITAAAGRLLACGRCHARWPFDQMACPFCPNRDRTRLTTFATQDGWYRVAACQVCERYLKMLDGRHATRPLLMPVDTIATLPLDAAAMQKGFR